MIKLLIMPYTRDLLKERRGDAGTYSVFFFRTGIDEIFMQQKFPSEIPLRRSRTKSKRILAPK